ncbi:AN1-type zinc finger protein 2A-like isoform X4 [Ambystoma mexicanum]|uniref:AN1-type zinc finger protein 2A-like isoform X4 n=1 Tax=Ambystoma mexicanum TaxID=8296 RepID=UPI0037E8781D
MEFPDLGKHCSEHTCKQLDFLPMKCDACEQIFCKDHIAYIQHSCTSAYKKDVQVPVCPLCNIPIPVKRGQMPDIVVGAHIDQDCKSDPAQRKRKIYTNRCLKPGCKQKEMMKVICDQCHGNFCLKHRHPLDHECKGGMAPISKAGYILPFCKYHRFQMASDGFLNQQWQIRLNGWMSITLMWDDSPGPICPLAVPATRSNVSLFTVV